MARHRLLALALSLACSSVALAQSSNDGLNSLSDDRLLSELASRNMTRLLERAFEKHNTPPEQRKALMSRTALTVLQTRGDTLPADERQAVVTQVVQGLETSYQTIKDPQLLMEQASLLILKAIPLDVNTLEYWGSNTATQARLKPTMSLVRKLLDRTQELATAQSNDLANRIRDVNDTANINKYEAAERLAQTAAYTRAIATYSQALSLDPADKTRATIAQEAIDYLTQFDTPETPTRNQIRLVLAKLNAVHGGDLSFQKSRELFSAIQKEPTADAATQYSEQYEARYFAAVTEVLARSLPNAQERLQELTAWLQMNAPPAASKSGIEAATQMLQYRVYSLAAEQSTSPDARVTAKNQASNVLMELLKNQPQLQGIILEQLRTTVDANTPLTQLDPLLLRSIVAEGEAQVIKSFATADKAIVGRAAEAAKVLIDKPGSLDDKTRDSVAFLRGILLEAADKQVDAAGAYLEFAEKNQSDLERAKTHLGNAQRVISQLRKTSDTDVAVRDLYDRVLPLSVNAPFNQSDAAFTYAYRLQQTGKSDQAVKVYDLVPKSDPNYSASRYFQMIALSQQLDDLAAASTDRPLMLQRVQALADEVRSTVLPAESTAEQKRTLQSRLVRTNLLAAELARTQQSDPKRALTLLSGFEDSAKGLPDAQELLGEAAFIRVQANMANGDTQKAVDGLIELLNANDGRQGLQIVFSMLTKLEQDFAEAEKAGKPEAMARLQQSRAALTPFLVKWAQESTKPEIKQFAYQYAAYDAETQRMAAELTTDPAQRKQLLEKALERLNDLESEANFDAYRRSLEPDQAKQAKYDRQVTLAIARCQFALQNWDKARDRFGRLLADRAVGSPVLIVRESGTEKEVDNDTYWEATYKWAQATIAAGGEKTPIVQMLREQQIRFGEHMGGEKWHAKMQTLATELGVTQTPTTAASSF